MSSRTDSVRSLQKRKPTTEDHVAAEKVVQRHLPELQSRTAEFQDEVEKLIDLRTHLGAYRFDLRYGLRKPFGPWEYAERKFMSGKISKDELRKMGKDGRPIDETLLQMIQDHMEYCLKAYSQMLITIAEIAHEPDPGQSLLREPEVDLHVELMGATLSIPSRDGSCRATAASWTASTPSSSSAPSCISTRCGSRHHHLAVEPERRREVLYCSDRRSPPKATRCAVKKRHRQA